MATEEEEILKRLEVHDAQWAMAQMLQGHAVRVSLFTSINTLVVGKTIYSIDAEDKTLVRLTFETPYQGTVVDAEEWLRNRKGLDMFEVVTCDE